MVKQISKVALFVFLTILLSCNKTNEISNLRISENQRFFTDENGNPVFWLGDTGWLLFGRLNRDEVDKYLEDRRMKGYNVIQIMVIHDLKNPVNYYGDSAFINKDVSKPFISEGNDTVDSMQYDFWDHVDYCVDKASEKGLYAALVPIWGNNVKNGMVSREQAYSYGKFIAQRYKDRKNIIWLNGGDVKGSDSIEVWNALGNSLFENDPNHLITYHPRGRNQSSMWFHNEKWLAFNVFQSGHKDYAQDTASNSLCYGEDNWRYIVDDYAKTPAKPTFDAEPIYEYIPHGLHDTAAPRWTASDMRRYAYWSVFAGGCGFTYGHNAVMQFYRPVDKEGAYGCKRFWYDALNDSGAVQMQYLKDLMLSKPYFERIPDQSMIAEQGERYNYLLATRGSNYAFVYTYNGRIIKLNMGKIAGDKVKASWYNPRDGEYSDIGKVENTGIADFKAPGEVKDGNDWVLVLESI